MQGSPSSIEWSNVARSAPRGPLSWSSYSIIHVNLAKLAPGESDRHRTSWWRETRCTLVTYPGPRAALPAHWSLFLTINLCYPADLTFESSFVSPTRVSQLESQMRRTLIRLAESVTSRPLNLQEQSATLLPPLPCVSLCAEKSYN